MITIQSVPVPSLVSAIGTFLPKRSPQASVTSTEVCHTKRAIEPLIVAHRGASNDAPENTIAAFVLAWMQRADAIEGDFRLTRDGRIVCIHDETTERTTNSDLTVARTGLERLKSLDASKGASSRYAGQTIPTIEEVLASLPAGKKLFAELKSGPEMIEPLREVLSHHKNAAEQVVLLSFDPAVLAAAHTALPEHERVLLCERKQPRMSSGTSSAPAKKFEPDLREVVELLSAAQTRALSCNATSLLNDRDFAACLVTEGYELHAWTVNRAGNARTLRDMGVRSITTNRPGWLGVRMR